MTFHKLRPSLDLVQREWLLTNGLGGFAMGTPLGCATRRYHGLLIAATDPPGGRILTLANTLERLLLPDRDPRRGDLPVELPCFRFFDLYHPTGYQYLVEFEADQNIRWAWRIPTEEGDVTFSRILSLVPANNIARIEYRIQTPIAFDLEVLPLIALRDFHRLSHEDDPEPIRVEPPSGGETPSDSVCLERNVRLRLSLPESQFIHSPDWWHKLYYPKEARRGMEAEEDLFVPGRFQYPVPAGKSEFTLSARVEAPSTPQGDYVGPIARTPCPATIGQPLHGLPDDTHVLTRLHQAANQFIVGENYDAIIAGYPWFGSWGRDTFVSLPGLLLTGADLTRLDIARKIIQRYGQARKEALIPNCFDEAGQPHYNSIDAPLWFIHACDAYLNTAEGLDAIDENTLREILTWCREIVEAFWATMTDAANRPGPEDSLMGRFQIGVDGDGLIYAGTEETQLTWMDASVRSKPVTPRCGKPVEINALWFHVLCLCADRFAGKDDAFAEHCTKLAQRVRRSFARRFRNAEAGGLYDVIDPPSAIQRLGTIRPNQIFTVSLPHSPLPKTRQKEIVTLVQRRLLTPFGLRSLDPDDERYHPRYAGGANQRDAAYHQGTVWPWLMGPFIEAYLRVNQFSLPARRRARQLLQPLIDHLDDAGLGQVSEVFDGDLPHRPCGCIAQAWSLAELIRTLSLIHSQGN